MYIEPGLYICKCTVFENFIYPCNVFINSKPPSLPPLPLLPPHLSPTSSLNVFSTPVLDHLLGHGSRELTLVNQQRIHGTTTSHQSPESPQRKLKDPEGAVTGSQTMFAGQCRCPGELKAAVAAHTRSAEDQDSRNPSRDGEGLRKSHPQLRSPKHISFLQGRRP